MYLLINVYYFLNFRLKGYPAKHSKLASTAVSAMPSANAVSDLIHLGYSSSFVPSVYTASMPAQQHSSAQSPLSLMLEPPPFVGSKYRSTYSVNTRQPASVSSAAADVEWHEPHEHDHKHPASPKVKTRFPPIHSTPKSNASHSTESKIPVLHGAHAGTRRAQPGPRSPVNAAQLHGKSSYSKASSPTAAAQRTVATKHSVPATTKTVVASSPPNASRKPKLSVAASISAAQTGSPRSPTGYGKGTNSTSTEPSNSGTRSHAPVKPPPAARSQMRPARAVKGYAAAAPVT